MKVIILVTLLVAGISAVPLLETKVKYDNYKVYRFVPQTEDDVKVLSSLETLYPGISFWKGVGKVHRPVDIMIPPHLQREILSGLQSTTLEVQEPLIEDVQKLIDEETAANAAAIAKAPKLGWEAYYDYQEILNFLDEQVALHPNVASLETYGQSFENRDLKVIKISTGGNGQRPIIFLDANIHAREWITNAVATYIINELLNGQESGLKSLLNTFDFHIAPVLNPDGYTYTRTNDRMWRKTRSNYAGALCRGADPNRNFGFMWNTGGASAICSSETYRGVNAFSESEAKAIADYYTTIQGRAAAYLSLHSYSQLVLIPYGTNINGNPRIPDHQNHMRVGNLVKQAIAQKSGTQFTVGNIVEILYVASGASVDWAKGVHDTTLAYTFELRDTGRYGFLLPPDQIVPSALEFIDGLVALANDLKVQLEAKK